MNQSQLGAFVRETIVATLRKRASDPLFGDSAEGRVAAKIADEVETAFDAYQNERLSTSQAAAESGYSRNQIRLLRINGVISDRRCDLPRKPGHGVVKQKPQLTRDAAADLADDVISAHRRRAS